MKHSDFSIGLTFYCGGKTWRCTDVGSRVIIAINYLDWTIKGPPYSIAELVFDENDFGGCSLGE